MRLKDQVDRLRSEILATAAANGAESVRLFGSAARGDESEASDIDFLVALRPGRSLLDLARLEAELELLLGRRVDVVTEASLHEPIRSTALKQAISV